MFWTAVSWRNAARRGSEGSVMLSLGDEDRPRVLRAFGAGGTETSGFEDESVGCRAQSSGLWLQWSYLIVTMTVFKTFNLENTRCHGVPVSILQGSRFKGAWRFRVPGWSASDSDIIL